MSLFREVEKIYFILKDVEVLSIISTSDMVTPTSINHADVMYKVN